MSLFKERPPPVPPSRPYSVFGNRKVAYPQTRVMRHSFPGKLSKGLLRVSHNLKLIPFSAENAAEVILLQGETVVVIGVSSKRGHLVVEKRNHTMHVPFHHMEMATRQLQQPQLNGIVGM